MKKSSIGILIAILVAIIIVFAPPAFAKNFNVLTKVSLDKTSDKDVVLNVRTTKKFLTKLILYEKSKNVYFVSLPETLYSGAKKLNVSDFKDNVSDLTVEFVSSAINKDSGYTKITIYVKDGTTVTIKELVATPRWLLALIFLAGILLVFIISYACFKLFNQFNYHKKFPKHIKDISNEGIKVNKIEKNPNVVDSLYSKTPDYTPEDSVAEDTDVILENNTQVSDDTFDESVQTSELEEDNNAFGQDDDIYTETVVEENNDEQITEDIQENETQQEDEDSKADGQSEYSTEDEIYDAGTQNFENNNQQEDENVEREQENVQSDENIVESLEEDETIEVVQEEVQQEEISQENEENIEDETSNMEEIEQHDEQSAETMQEESQSDEDIVESLAEDELAEVVQEGEQEEISQENEENIEDETSNMEEIEQSDEQSAEIMQEDSQSDEDIAESLAEDELAEVVQEGEQEEISQKNEENIEDETSNMEELEQSDEQSAETMQEENQLDEDVEESLAEDGLAEVVQEEVQQEEIPIENEKVAEDIFDTTDAEENSQVDDGIVELTLEKVKYDNVIEDNEEIVGDYMPADVLDETIFETNNQEEVNENEQSEFKNNDDNDSDSDSDTIDLSEFVQDEAIQNEGEDIYNDVTKDVNNKEETPIDSLLDILSVDDEIVLDNVEPDINDDDMILDNVESNMSDDEKLQDDIFPNPDEIINDILSNKDAIDEISETILENNFADSIESVDENNEFENIEPSDIVDSDFVEEDNNLDLSKEESIIENEDDSSSNDYSSAPMPIVSGGSVFEPKTFDLSFVSENNNHDENELDIQGSMHEENVDETLVEEAAPEELTFDNFMFDGILGEIPSEEDILLDKIESDEVFVIDSDKDDITESKVDTEENITIEESLVDNENKFVADAIKTEEPIIGTVENGTVQEDELDNTEEEKEVVQEEDEVINFKFELPAEFYMKKQTENIQTDEVNVDSFFEEEITEVSTEYFADTEEKDLTSFFKDAEPTEVVVPVVKQFIDDSEPVVLDQKEIDNGKVLYLLRHNGNYSLIGTIGNNVFVLNKFNNAPTQNNIIIKHNDVKDDKDIYIVKVGSWRALIGVSNNSMENVLTLS